MKIIKKYRWKLFNVLLVLVVLIINLISDKYWSNVCVNGNCDQVFLESVLAPTIQGMLALAFILTPFIFLPQHYFQSYFKQVFWWGFIFAFIWVYLADANSSHILSLSPELVAYNQGFVWGIATLLFIIFHWYRTRKCYRNKFHWWFIVVPIILMNIVPYLVVYL